MVLCSRSWQEALLYILSVIIGHYLGLNGIGGNPTNHLLRQVAPELGSSHRSPCINSIMLPLCSMVKRHHSHSSKLISTQSLDNLCKCNRRCKARTGRNLIPPMNKHGCCSTCFWTCLAILLSRLASTAFDASKARHFLCSCCQVSGYRRRRPAHNTLFTVPPIWQLLRPLRPCGSSRGWCHPLAVSWRKVNLRPSCHKSWES